MSYMELIHLANVNASNSMDTWTKALHIIHGGREARILIPYSGNTLAT